MNSIKNKMLVNEDVLLANIQEYFTRTHRGYFNGVQGVWTIRTFNAAKRLLAKKQIRYSSKLGGYVPYNAQ